MVEILNALGDKWLGWQWGMFWQVGVLVGIIWLVDTVIRRWAWPQVRYALWLLVLVKLLIPPTVTSRASITSQIPAAAQKVVSIRFMSEAEEAPPPAQTISSILPETISVQSTSNKQQATEEALPGSNSPAGSRPQDSACAAADVPAAITPNQTSQNPAPALSWKACAMLAWVFGVMVLSGWLLSRLRGLRKQHISANCHAGLDPASRMISTDRSQFNELLAQAAEKLKLKRLPEVILTEQVACPAVFGVFRPVLLIPAKFKNADWRDIEHILLHELAHIKRGDLLVHAVYMCLQIVYWFNPLLWLIRRTLQNLRELCCDATVAKLLKEDTVHYRRTLLETARGLLAQPVDPGLGLLGLFENSNWLVTRLQWLEKKTWKNRPLRIATVIALVSVMTVCVLPMANRSKVEEHPEGFRSLSLPYSAWMADIDGDDMKVLDLVSGDIITLEAMGNQNEFLQKIKETSQGDVFATYNAELKKPMVTFLRSAGVKGEPASNGHITLSPIPMEMPYENVVTTQAGCKFKFRIVSADENVCRIEYWPINRKARNAMEPAFRVTGTVTDAATGQPIAGASVYDDGYNSNQCQTTTDESGHFALQTANEEHTISAAAEGYQPQSKTLKTFPFANHENFDFQLTKKPEGSKQKAEELFDAVRKGNLSKVKEYISQGFDVNTVYIGKTVLHEAGPWGQTEIAQLLIEAGANINQKDQHGQTPLSAAASYSHQAEPTAKLLIEHGADVTLSDDKGMTPLHYACTGSMCEMLIEKCADIHARNNDGWTPLHYDCNWGRLSAVQYLLDKAADIEARDDEGRTPLMLASTNAHYQVVEYLISRGGELSVVDNEGKTALHWAVMKDQEQIRKLLDGQESQSSYKPGAVDKHYERICETIKTLLAHGASATVKDNSGLTAIDYAKKALNKSAVAILSNRETTQNSELKTQNYTAKLPNGVTVELLGLCSGLTVKDRTWWKPDGNPADPNEFEKYNPDIKPMTWQDLPDRQFKYAYLYRMTPVNNIAAASDVSAGDRWHSGYVDDSLHIGYAYSHSGNVDNFPEIGGIKVAVASGDFEEFESNVYNGSMNGAAILSDRTTNVSISGPRNYSEYTDKLVDVSVTSNAYQIAVSYELTEGTINEARDESQMGGPGLCSFAGGQNPLIRHSFLVSDSFEKIKKFIVKYRKYEVVTFKKIALRPGVKTQVEMSIDEGGLAKDEGVESNSQKAEGQKATPFCVYGRVVNTSGKPMSSVTVRASCGWHTLMPTGSTSTDEQGNYQLYFGPGMRYKIAETDQWGVGFQAVTIHAEKNGYYETNLCQQANLAMAGSEKQAAEHPWRQNFKGLVLAHQPYELNFEMAPSAVVRGTVTDLNGTPLSNLNVVIAGKERYPSSSALLNITTDEKGGFTIDSVPLKPYWFEYYRDRTWVKTKPVSFDEPSIYDIVLVYDDSNKQFTVQKIQIDASQNVSLRPGGKTEVEAENRLTPGTKDESFNWVVPFEITKQSFLENDWIEITHILGPSYRLKVGQTYAIKGKYNLSSCDRAMLHIYATNGETQSEQGPVLERGSGEFTRTFTYLKEGWLHLSFYPADGGNSFGSLYFAENGSSQQVPDISQITSFVKTETASNVTPDRDPGASDPITQNSTLQTQNYTAALPDGVTAEPKLEFLAWQSDSQSWWHADGSVVSDNQSLNIITNLPPVDCQDEAHPDYEWIKVLFSHPAFNKETISQLKMFDLSGNPINFIGRSSSMATDVNAPKGDGGGIFYVVSVGKKEDYPKTCTFELEYAAGPWKTEADKLPKEYHDFLTFGGDGVLLEVTEREADKTTLCYVHDTQYLLGRQRRFVAVTQDRVVPASHHTKGGAPNHLVEKYTFDVPFEEIECFQSQIRRIQTVTFKNVSLRPGVKTDVNVENQSSSAGSQPGWVRSDRPGAVENDFAFKFDGSRSYAKIAPNPVLDIRDSLTLSAWVKNEGDDDGQILWRGDNQGGRDPYELHMTGSRMEFRLNPLDGTFTSAVQSRQPVDNHWHLWTAVYDSQAKSIFLYKDGQLEAEAETPVGFQYDTSAMWNMIGAVDFGNWQHFKGSIDEARIWNRALAPAEVQQQAEGIYQPNDANLVVHWTFNEGQGDTIHDVSGNNNHAQALSWTDPIGYIPPQQTLVDIAPTDFKMQFDEQRMTYSLVVSIKNDGDVTLPKHKIRYYRGDLTDGLDETGNPHTGWHEAGPIEPGKEWNESTRGFSLKDGDYTFTVALDYDYAVAESNETNNQKAIHVKVQDGQVTSLEQPAPAPIPSNPAADAPLFEKPDEEKIKTAAQQLFENIKNADYEMILQDYSNDQWQNDGWKKLLPHEYDYMARSDFPSLVKWICQTFRQNPIADIEVGKVFTTDIEILGRTGRPAVSYVLRLQDQSIIIGYLPFRKITVDNTELWQPVAGIDWHLREKPILDKSFDTKDDDFWTFGIFKPLVQVGAIVKIMTLSEKDLVNGLKFCAELSGGKYPASLGQAAVNEDLQRWVIQKYGETGFDNKTKHWLRDEVLKVWYMSFYYKKLQDENKSPEYFGSHVRPKDPDGVLLRWQKSDKEFRVIYGDLRTETVVEMKDGQIIEHPNFNLKTIAASLPTAGATNAVNPAPSDRLELLQQMLDETQQRYQNGVTDMDEVLGAKINLLTAESEAAESQALRIDKLKQIEAVCSEWVKMTERKKNAGLATTAQLNTAKLKLLDAQKALMTAQEQTTTAALKEF